MDCEYVLRTRDGGTTMLLTTGRLDIVRAEDGSIVEFTNRAPTKNVCAALE